MFSVAFTDKEHALIETYAEQEGTGFEEAVEKLVSDGLARRIQRKTGRRPSSIVANFHKRR